MPYNTLFPGQEANEKIIMVLRRHFLVFLKIIFVFIILLCLPLLIKYILSTYTEFLVNEMVKVSLSLLMSLYYIFVVTFFFRAWLDYYLDIWVITSERIVNIEQKGLFSRQISEQRLFRIQDVTAKVKGIIPTFFHYGDLYVQSAGSEPYFIFKKIPNPYEVTKKLTKLVNWKKKNLSEEDR